MTFGAQDPEDVMELDISLETVCRLIIRAREFEAQVPAIETDADDDPTDSDDSYAVIEDEANNVVEDEIRSLLEDMPDDALAQILALAMVGRGTFDPLEWDDALEEAASDAPGNAIDQMLDMPMLAAYLEAGLAAFDLGCDGIGQID